MIRINEYTGQWDRNNRSKLRAGSHVKVWQAESGETSADAREVDGFRRAIKAAGLRLDFLHGTSKTATYELVRE